MDHLYFTLTFDHSTAWFDLATSELDYKLIAKTSRHGRGVCDVSKTATIPMTFWQRIIQFITRWIVVYSQLAPNVTFTVKQMFSPNVWYCVRCGKVSADAKQLYTVWLAKRCTTHKYFMDTSPTAPIILPFSLNHYVTPSLCLQSVIYVFGRAFEEQFIIHWILLYTKYEKWRIPKFKKWSCDASHIIFWFTSMKMKLWISVKKIKWSF